MENITGTKKEYIMRKTFISILILLIVLGFQSYTQHNEEQTTMDHQEEIQSINEREVQLKMPPFQGLPSVTIGGKNRNGKTIVLMQPISSPNPLNVVTELDLSGQKTYYIEIKK